ncbi:ABC transporter ATP-binding protein [Saccharothrix deserti]|uniref:ABC transporter ATP-binding protein n=1 Tax=Saccharothrix deserti TaxID=2593674 RepID=UPI00131EAFE5|nr:ABC transporter ATP-binding protein [Saccharothrix deserti]
MNPSSPELPPSLPSLWRSLKLGFRVEPLLLVVAGVTTVAAALPDALFAVAFAWFAAAMVSGDDQHLLASGVTLAVLAVGTWLLNVASDRVNLRLAERAAVPIESHVARLQSSVVTIEHQERSDILDLLALLRDHSGTLSQLYRSLFVTAGAGLRLLLTVGLLMSIEPWLGLLVVFALPSLLVSARRAPIEKRVEEAGAADRRLARQLFVLGATASTSKEIRIAGVQDRLRELRDAAWGRQYRALARARWASACLYAASWGLFGLAFVAAVTWVSLAFGPAGPTAGAVVLVVAAGGRLSQYVSQAVTETQFLRGIWLEGSRRLAWLEDYAATQGKHGVVAVPDRIEQGIRLENVSFNYSGSTKPVLQDVSVTLPAGSVVAIVGENGAGKSTLVKLLCRFYEPSSGRILLDGADLGGFAPEQWRSRLSGTFQDFVKFEYSAAMAIGLGNLTRIEDRSAILRAVERAGAEQVVEGLPDGLDTQLGNTWRDGVEPSHGQWQRIALARGFMREDPLLLVLDEPTAALDAETEHAIFTRYAEAARSGAAGSNGRITVLVSHRFSTVRMADLIVVLDGCHVAEVGSHQQLMARGGKYAESYAIQEASYR